MSWFANLEHNFATFAEKELAAFSKEALTIEPILSSILQYGGMVLQTVVTVEAGQPAGAIVGKVILDAQAGLVAIRSTVYDAGATPSISSTIASIQTNLNALISAGHVTNPTSVANITKVVNALGAIPSALGA